MFRNSPEQIGWLMANSRLGGILRFQLLSVNVVFSYLTYYHRRNEGFVKTRHNKIKMISLSEQILTFCLSSSFNGLKQVKVLLRMSDSLQQLFCLTHVPVSLSSRCLKQLLIFFQHFLLKYTFMGDVELSCSAALMYISPKINASLTRHFGETPHSTCLSH